MTDALDREIDANYDAFQRNLALYLPGKAGKIALLHACKTIGFYDSVAEAARHGNMRFPDHLYSLQPVIEEPVDLGFFSHAGG
ncbi:MAG: hypothetical protein RL367_816 [Pseudomonadota bacterium]